MVRITKKVTNRAAAQGIDLSLLRKESGLDEGKNLGGDFRLPEGFDSRNFVGSFVDEKGVLQATQRQVLANIARTADGWALWKFPDTYEEYDPVTKKTKEVPHPNAGQTHKVTTLNGACYVLMFRDRGVQEAVNFAYGEASRSRLDAEAYGETVAGNAPDDTGVLTEERLNQIPSLRSEKQMLDAELDRDIERGAHVATHGITRSRNITKKTKRLRKT